MNSQKVKLGVLALQGAIEEHVSMTSRAFKSMNVDGEVLWVKRPEHLEEIRGLILPGGESTVTGRLLETGGLLDAVRDFAARGGAILGTCSGMVLLASEVYDRVVGKTGQPTLELLDITVERKSGGIFRGRLGHSIARREKVQGRIHTGSSRSKHRKRS